ncbi:hypothetical protein [Vibrio sp. EA2]|uniref:hypothetical protein n=1 Tax=Vibrio sp. EA2 TaxID=3079860 RepID=UPI002948E3D4|nr:hypothetical protein [Vibrio sp. EA2]MDV6250983.1 hypothetical protein [Vibrio sp. EA2]
MPHFWHLWLGLECVSILQRDQRSDLSPRKISPILMGMKTKTLLSQLNFVYRAKVKAVCNASDEFDGMSKMSIDSSFNIQIEGSNCTNDEFAKRFFVVHGEGHLEGDGWLVLYVNSLEVSEGEEIEIPSDVAFDAMIENRVQEAEAYLEQLYVSAMENIEQRSDDDFT